ncbi:microtubule organization protein AKNA isoform X2 [Melanotaenia boesemani]|uniref:microtubule organization protein AKNA isoform X2 n=1 Tax=Melanotaenia boesemani TaxID=1250792 RepID=UPI001C03B3E9|nr:microtubule organization protein AKNA isoform X2 [Melanotaenia boesemani]
MERRRCTTAGVMFWTPAPDRTSPTSTVTPEDTGEEEDEERANQDFVSQMDENGIIGLSEALEEAELGETCDVLSESKPPGWAGPFTPEEGDCSGCVRDRPAEELSSSLRDPLDHTESAGEVSQVLLPCYNISGLKALTEDEQRQEHFSEGVKCLDMTEEEKCFTWEEAGSRKGQNKLVSSIRSAGVSNHHCPVPQSALTSAWPHLFHFTAEELASAPGIEAETFPEMDFTESRSESYCSHTSLKSSPRCPEMNLGASPQPAASLSEPVASNHNSRLSKLPVPLPRKTKQNSPESACARTLSCSTNVSKSKLQNKSCDIEPKTPRVRTDAIEEDDNRKGSLSYHTPDFSKVEPKVNFPKYGYMPPKSRLTSTRKSLSPEPPLVFKSPAEIVKEVLLNTDESSLPSDSNTPHADAVNCIVPQEFRCQEQATALLEQLQEDYNRLLTKYAEAENTIDRLRLEAKSQRAEINSTSCPDGHTSHQESADPGPSSRSPGPQLGQQLTNILFSQTDKFLQQLQTFEDLIKSGKLKPLEKVKGLSQLAKGLNSLERGYLLAQDEHKLLQQRGVETCRFDPERELEGLIFQCGLRVDELKEQIEHIRKEHPTYEASHSPAPQATSLSSLSDEGETPTHSQSSPVPSLVDPGDAEQVKMSSASKGGSEEEAEDEEALNLLHPRPQINNHRCVKVLHIKEGHKAPPSAASKTDIRHGGEEEERQGQRTRKDEVQNTLPKRNVKSDQDPPAGTNKQRSTRSSLPLRNQSTMLPVLLRPSRKSSRRGKSNSSSLSSLVDFDTPETKSTKARTASRRVPSQDGIISPETDSGFVGSEGSHLTPPAAASILHQGASESISGVHEESSRRPQAGQAAAGCPFSSSSPSDMGQEPRVGSKQARRARQEQRRPRSSYSLQEWITEEEQNRIDSGTSEFRLESVNAVSGSEAEYANSINSVLSSCSNFSPVARCRHGDSLSAQSPAQAVNQVIHSLQAEITLLKEKLESCLKNNRATPSAQSSCSHYTTPTPRISSGQQWSDASQGKKESQTADEVGEGSALRPTRKRSASTKMQRAQQDFLPASNMETSTSQPQPQSQVARCTQTSAAPESCCSHTSTLHSRRTQNQPVCISSTHPSPCCHRCPHCGCSEPHRCTEPDLYKQAPPKHPNCQAAGSPDRAGRTYFAAEEAPPPVQCMTVCPPQLLLYPSPVIMSPHNITETSSEARRLVERRRRHSLSVDKRRSLDGSLDRAIRAAQQMQHTSGHMARSLAQGLQYQELNWHSWQISL